MGFLNHLQPGTTFAGGIEILLSFSAESQPRKLLGLKSTIPKVPGKYRHELERGVTSFLNTGMLGCPRAEEMSALLI